MTETFEKTNWFWRIERLQQQFGEWLELQLSRTQPNLPSVSLPSWFWRVAFWAIAALLILGIIWLVWQFRYLLSRRRSWRIPNLAKASQSQPNLTAATWRQRAQDFTSVGNYTEACRCLYQAMLQHLNDRHIVTHQLSRTDGEYRHLVQFLPQSSAYQQLLETHERLCFGKVEMSQFDYEQCTNAEREIATTEVKQ